MTDFRKTVHDLLGGDLDHSSGSDYEIICRLERLVAAHRELSDLSKRLDDINSSSRPGRLVLRKVNKF